MDSVLCSGPQLRETEAISGSLELLLLESRASREAEFEGCAYWIF